MKRLAKVKITAPGAEVVISPNTLRFYEDDFRVELEAGVYGVPAEDEDSSQAKLYYAEPSDSENSLLHSLRLVENTDYDFSIILNKDLAQFKRELKAIRGQYPFRNNKLAGFISLNAASAWSSVDQGKLRVTGRINLKNYAGVADFSLHEQAGEMKLLLSVLTEKLTDEANLFGILSELAALCDKVIFQLDAPTEVGLLASGEADESPIIFAFHLRRLLRDGRFAFAIDQITSKPAYRNRQSRRVENIAFASFIDLVEVASNPLSLEWVRGGPLANRFLGYTPSKVPVTEPVLTFDIPENQYVKSFLSKLIGSIDAISNKLGEGADALRQDLASASDYISGALSSSLWKNVSESKLVPYSMIMQQRIGYRDFSEATSSFGLEATLARAVMGSDDLSGELKPVWHLYQIWCCIQMMKILNVVCGKPEDESLENIFDIADFRTGIKVGGKAIGNWTHGHSSAQVAIELYYNKEFRSMTGSGDDWSGSYSLGFLPDISIALSQGNQKHWLHFDAKYRVDKRTFREFTKFERAKTEDLEKMHVYRDALLGTRGSYVLYPSIDANLRLFVRHADPQYRDATRLPSIGAFPLHPGEGSWGKEQRDSLSAFIIAAIATVGGGHYQEETGFG